MAIHSSILTRTIPWTEEPGGLQSMGCKMSDTTEQPTLSRKLRAFKTVSSVQLLSCVPLFATPWIAAHQLSLSITNSQSLLKLMSFESVMPSNHLILWRHLLLLPSIFPRIRVFSNVTSSHQVAKVLDTTE